MEGYRSPKVCELVGISFRQTDYWARTGLVRPSVQDAQGSGSQREYSFEDMVRLSVVKGLLDVGMELPRIRRVVGNLRALDGMLVIGENGVEACRSLERVAQLLSRPGGFACINVDRVREELAAKVG